jgi:hypothetical protein
MVYGGQQPAPPRLPGRRRFRGPNHGPRSVTYEAPEGLRERRDRRRTGSGAHRHAQFEDGRTVAFEVLHAARRSAASCVWWAILDGAVSLDRGRPAPEPGARSRPRPPTSNKKSKGRRRRVPGASEARSSYLSWPRSSTPDDGSRNVSARRVDVRQSFRRMLRTTWVIPPRLRSSGSMERIEGSPEFSWSGDLRYRSGGRSNHPDIRRST